MRPYILIIFGTYMFIGTPAQAVAASYPDHGQIDYITADWKCLWCPKAEKSSTEGQVQAGAGYVTNDSAKHGDYTGLDEKGVHTIVDGSFQFKNSQGIYASGQAKNLGLDSRRMEIMAGNQGRYQVGVEYQELPKLYSDTTRTPYNGDSNLTLAGGGGYGADTQSMPQLAGELRNIDINTQRKTLMLSGGYNQSANLAYAFKFKRETKEGNRSAGLALGNTFALTRSALVAIPVDFVTQEGQFNVDYQHRRWNGSIQYKYSTFKNENSSVRWDNIFTEPAGVTDGQAALEPDNTMHQLSLTAMYRMTADSQVNALFSTGLMKQDENYLPYTINGSLSPAPLPRSSLDGEINTYDASVTAISKVNEKSRIKFQFKQHEQDNDTPRSTYDYIAADTSTPLIVAARSNFPYSFKRQQYALEGDYALKVHRKVSAGIDKEKIDRTYQEVEQTTEDSYWIKFKNQVSDNFNYDFKFSIAKRDGNNYEPVTEINPPENTLLRKYNLADRERDMAAIRVNYRYSSDLDFGFYTDHASDDYNESELGLQESKQASFSIDVRHSVSDALIVSIDYTKTNIDSTQAGSEVFSSPDWRAKNKDEMQTAHIGIDYIVKKGRLKLGFDYAYADLTGDISVSPGESFPGITTVRHTLSANAEYTLNKKSALYLLFRYEDYQEKNWSNDGILPNSIPNVLTLGEISPDYNIGMFVVSYKYIFN